MSNKSMKYASLALVICSLFACMSVKKAGKKMSLENNSLSVKAGTKVQVAKSDSTATGNESSVIKIISDSDYSKTTVIREYYSGGFNIDDSTSHSSAKEHSYISVKTGKNSAHEARPGSARTGRLLYRETTIKETGVVKKQEEKTSVINKDVSLKKSDSTTVKKSDSMATKMTTKTETKQVNRKGGLAWWMWIVVAAVVYVICRLYKIIRSKWL